MTRLLRALSTSLWGVPLLCVLGAIVALFVNSAIDQATGYRLVPRSVTGSPGAVLWILSTVAAAMVTLTTLVLTVITVAVQVAMGQFSPRIVRALLHDRRNQLAHGLFAGTFVYTLFAIRLVNDQSTGADAVPGFTVLVSYLLAMASVITLILYVHHAGQALRVSGLIDLVGEDLRAQLDRMYPARLRPPRNDGVVLAPRPGVVVGISVRSLVAEASRAGCTLELVPVMGDFVPAGSPLVRVHGDWKKLNSSRVAKLVHLADERTHGSDPAYAFRKLVDIAERAISSPFNDPTTAVQAIDRLHDSLRQLAARPFPNGEHTDREGTLRLIVSTMGWDGYVRLSFDEIRLAGAGSPQVARRLAAALEDLCTVALPDRVPVLERELALLGACVRRAYADEFDAAAALVPDPQGIGSGRDL
jgi:uncharacterized membrane protein